MPDEEYYEDDFEDYEDDEFEEDEDTPAEPSPAPTKRNPLPTKPSSPAPPRHTAPWSLITLQELELEEQLAAGAFSRVHAGTWRGRDVAVKVLTDTSSSQLQACEQELMVHAALTAHAGIVRLHGANLSPPDCCIVLERCRHSLFERLHRFSGDLDRRELVGWAIQAAEAMQFLHAQSPPVVHRDLKSHNVLLDADGRCRLCDFGLVHTREATAGTPNYMAPELFAAKPYSTPVDVFAFGVLLNELFAREVPWDGYQPLDIRDKVAAGERPRTSKTMPHAAEGLLRKAWHQHASLRPPFKQIVPSLRAIEEALPLGAALLDARYGGGLSGRGSARFSDALDDFASLGLNKNKTF